jgi:hypothetical protein
VQALPVKAVLPTAPAMAMRLRSAASCSTASATEELSKPMAISTRSASNQRRAIAAPMSALFWWSATAISTGLPSTVPPASSTAMRAAIAEPGPPRSA